MKGSELQTFVADYIADRRRALDALEAAVRDALATPVQVAEAVVANGHKPSKQKQRRPTVAPGSIEDRIIGVLTEAGEPVRTAVIVEQAKAKPHHVTAALKALRAANRIAREGATTSLRWRLL